MSSSLRIPSEVLKAAELKFSTRITGFLWQPFPQGWSLAGELYGDLSGRFEEGGMIQTSAIMELRWEHRYALAYTFSDSCYVLVRPLDDWDEKLKNLFIHEAPQGSEG
jgi:hypothetical protein